MYYKPYCYNFALKHWETALTLRQVWDLFPRVWRQMEDVTLLRNPLLLWQTGVSTNSGTLNCLILKCISCNNNKIGLKEHYVNFSKNHRLVTNNAFSICLKCLKGTICLFSNWIIWAYIFNLVKNGWSLLLINCKIRTKINTWKK